MFLIVVQEKTLRLVSKMEMHVGSGKECGKDTSDVKCAMECLKDPDLLPPTPSSSADEKRRLCGSHALKSTSNTLMKKKVQSLVRKNHIL